MDSGETRQLAIARHRLYAAAHRIVADCDRLLSDLGRLSRSVWWDATGEALLAGRHLMAAIERHFDDSTAASVRNRLLALYQDVRDPQRRIVRSMTALLALIPAGLEDELLQQDARAIRETAVGLLAVDTQPTAEHAAPSAPAGPPISRQGPIAPMPPRARLLVVDDDEAPRRALSRLLDRLGYDVTVARDGSEALGIAQHQPLDLIVTDITMPEMDGYELLARLKSTDQTRNIPIIVVSGVDDVASVVRCIERGAEDHLTKPYEAVLLQARVRASLERKRMRDLELAYLNRVARLTAAAEAVERQVYEPGALADLAQEADELGRLARVFDRMASGIRSREEQLEARLRQLRREIRQVSQPGRASGAISQESPFIAGQVLADRYEIREELGKGGMGMVYLAGDRVLGEDVALKILRRELVGQDPSLLERLKSEIRLARRISHRNVVRAHDLGEWEGVHFLTMEYVRGITLAELLTTRGRLSVESTLAIGAQLADALTVAHDQDIIHRDIKPANLLVDEGGVLKVMDFGLARPVQRTGELTQAGFVVGTPRYMAPEQLFGGDMDARSDLFSVGVVFYECLTGKPPYEASTPIAVVAKMLEGPPPSVHHLSPDVPVALSRLIDRLLQREPDDRIRSARELGEQLSQVGRSST